VDLPRIAEPTPVPKLSDTKIRSARPRERPYKLFDSEGLFLSIQPNGGRWWRQRYYLAGKEQLLSLGTYPEITLAEAREKGAIIRKQVAHGANPSAERQQKKIARRDAMVSTYKAVALEWLEKTGKARQWSVDHSQRTLRRLEVHFFPWVGPKPIADVTDDDVMACLRRMEDRNLIDTAHRALSENDSLFRYAKKRKYVKHNVVADLRGPDTLPRTKIKHHAAITDPVQLATLLRALDAYHGGFVVRCAIRLLPLVFVRPGELQWATWSEFDLDGAEWRLPAERMKMREYHIVPLSRQAVAILREVHLVSGPEGYVFPQARNASRPISENTLNVALRGIGYTKEQQTAHGFRRTASTLLNEQGWNRDAIERQLAHGERDPVRGSYNAAQYLPERRRMMQAWSDYIDGLKAGSNGAAI
jgi:integrase